MSVNFTQTNTFDPSLYLLYGPGRSGTTWLGAIVNSHPDVAYRFEPFGRRNELQSIHSTWQAVVAGEPSPTNSQLLYNSLLPANPLLDKPPFFRKTNVFKWGQGQLWPLSKILPAVPALYEYLYTPKGTPPIVFKEVSWGLVQRLLNYVDMECVFILRSPYGTVSSCQRGQDAGLMPIWERDNLATVLKNCGSNLAQELPIPLDDLSNIQRNAVLWRLDAERIVGRVQCQPNSLLVIYEELCTEPTKVAKQVFKHFKLPWHEQVDAFIGQSTLGSKGLRRKEGAIQSYFSVSRNTGEASKRWQQELTDSEVQDINAIVSPSNAFAFLQERSGLVTTA